MLKTVKRQGLIYLIFTLFPILFLTCKEEENLPEPASLSFVESSLPEEELSAAGGNFTITVEWAFTDWNLTAGEVIEGDAFIIKASPPAAGAPGIGQTQTRVSVTYGKNNSSSSKNVQKLILSSPSGDLTKSITLTQNFEPIQTYQTISGFGGGNMMWGFDYLNADEIRKAFGTGEDELGLSIFRVRLSSNRNDWSRLVPTLLEAQKYGVTILASPWSPPAALKSNNSDVGGHLLPQNYEAYANYLNDFVQYMKGEGITIDAVSVQNEPDIQVGYESSDWTIDEIYNFVRDYGHIIKDTKLVAAESFNFKQSYTDKILKDPVAAENLDIVGGHIYGGGLAPYPLAQLKGKEVWMTEYLMNQNAGSNINNWNTAESAIWDETLRMLETIHKSMEYNWNAYIWWYIRRFYSFLGDGEQGTSRGEILKRGYALSHYSKFVRPGYQRVEVQAENTSGLQITAYIGDNKMVFVIINPTTETKPGVTLWAPQSISSATTYTTSVSDNRKKETVNPDENKIEIEMAPKSITTAVLEF